MEKLLLALLLAQSPQLPAQPAGSGMVAQKAPVQTKIVNPEPNTPWPYQHFVETGIRDRSGDLWFGTSDGVYRYDGATFTNYRVMDGLHVDKVSRMMEDKAGMIWFGGEGGVVRYDPASAAFTAIGMQPAVHASFIAGTKDLPKVEVSQRVTHIMEDRSGSIWFCAAYHVYRTDGRSPTAVTTGIGNFLKSEKVKMSCGIPDDFGIRAICEDRQGNILFSVISCCNGFDATYCLSRSRIGHPCVAGTCKHNRFNQLELDAHHGEIAASFTRITRSDNDSSMAFTTCLKDRNGNTWFGGPDGAYRYDGKHFIPFTRNDLLSRSIVSTIYEDRSGNIWFGTGPDRDYSGNGIFRYTPADSLKGNRSLAHFTRQDGVCTSKPFDDNVVTTIMQDRAGRIWFGGDAGICFYDPATASFVNLGRKQGVTDSHVRFILEDRAGSTWFGTWDMGLYAYKGKKVTRLSK